MRVVKLAESYFGEQSSLICGWEWHMARHDIVQQYTKGPDVHLGVVVFS